MKVIIITREYSLKQIESDKQKNKTIKSSQVLGSYIKFIFFPTLFSTQLDLSQLCNSDGSITIGEDFIAKRT